MSGRFRSAACADFFPCHPAPVEEAPERANASGHARLRHLSPDLLQRHVELLVDKAQDQYRLRLNAR
jgi:hypothetical protein